MADLAAALDAFVALELEPGDVEEAVGLVRQVERDEHGRMHIYRPDGTEIDD